jgi:ectoine hydroxylase-related dioxygenase (phytanoyl-CoA dioxygenase family)
MNMPWVESPFFEEILKTKTLTPQQEATARHFNEFGYAIIENIIEDDLAERIIEDLNPFYPGDCRLQDAWQKSEAVRALTGNKRVLEVLHLLYERVPRPFQTLNFRYGSEQPAHSDSIHFSCFPARFMCGVWVALENVSRENGPLFYYPGSHKIPEYNLDDIGLSVERADYQEYERFVAKLMKAKGYRADHLIVPKGTALVWSSNLFHGGSIRLNPNSTRHSQVTHYFFDDCIYYTPLLSDVISGEYFVREDVRDIISGKQMPLNFNGLACEISPARGPLKRLSAPRSQGQTAPPLEAPTVKRCALNRYFRVLKSILEGRQTCKSATR